MSLNVLLISTYEMGRQPFGLASPAAWLRQAGAEVRCLDLSIESLETETVRWADLVGFYVPMHMGTRMAVPVIEQVRCLNPTVGDSDFLNGRGYAIPLVRALHREFPHLTYDVTIKVEHLRKYAQYLPELKQTGCLFVTSAVGSFNERILTIFEKHHTGADFQEALRLCSEVALLLVPTFVAFTPWTTLSGYRHFSRPSPPT